MCATYELGAWVINDYCPVRRWSYISRCITTLDIDPQSIEIKECDGVRVISRGFHDFIHKVGNNHANAMFKTLVTKEEIT